MGVRIDHVFLCIETEWCFQRFFADPPSPELIKRGHRATVFYSNVNFLVPAIAAASLVVLTIAISLFCYRHRKCGIECACTMVFEYNGYHSAPTGQNTRSIKESLECRQNSEAAQRERYYATIHKVALQNGEKIPGSQPIFVSTI